jgi:uncharacterized protein (UPF0332 family)
MLTDDEVKLINFFQTKAQQSIKAADALLKLELYNDGVNRQYYSVLYQVKALLLCVKITVEKHSSARTMLALHFTKNKLIDKDTFDTFTKLLKLRMDADYTHFVQINHDEAADFYYKALHFIDVTNVLIDQAIERDQEEIEAIQNKEHE